MTAEAPVITIDDAAYAEYGELTHNAIEPDTPGLIDHRGRFLTGFSGWPMRKDLPKVVLYPEDGYGVGNLRMYLPGREIHKAGLANVFYTNSFSLDTLQWADLCVFQRIQRKTHLECLKYAKDVLKKPVVLDTDDNFQRVSRTIRRQKSAQMGGDLSEHFERAALAADVLTVSTPELSRVYGPLHKNLFVCLNRIDFDQPVFRARQRFPGTVTIGYAGSGATREDFAPAARGLERLLRENAGVRVVCLGEDYRPVFAPDVRWRILVRPWTGYATFRQYYRDFDVGLAPALDTPFSRSKSFIKALDYAGFAIPTVAGDTAPYRQFAGDDPERPNLLLARSPDDWYNHLKRLVDDADFREGLGRRAREHASTRYHVKDAPTDWWPAWQTALERRP